MDVATVEYCEPKVLSHNFHFNVCDLSVIVQAVKLEKSLFLWVGSLSQPILEDLAVSMSTPYGQDPLQTKLMGDVLDMKSMTLGSRLSKKLNKPVYASFNLDCDKLSLSLIETRIADEMKKFPNLF